MCIYLCVICSCFRSDESVKRRDVQTDRTSSCTYDYTYSHTHTHGNNNNNNDDSFNTHADTNAHIIIMMTAMTVIRSARRQINAEKALVTWPRTKYA